MADSFLICAAVGTALGALSGLGIGGGSLLMMWLTLIAGKDAETARMMNLMFFLPGALISTWLRRKQSLAPLPVTASACGAGVAGAVLGSWLSNSVIDASVLRPVLGVLFLVTGVRELCYRERKLR